MKYSLVKLEGMEEIVLYNVENLMDFLDIGQFRGGGVGMCPKG